MLYAKIVWNNPVVMTKVFKSRHGFINIILLYFCKYLPLRNVWINCKFLHVGMLTLCVKFSYKWSMWSWWKEKFELIPFPNGRFVPGLDENGSEVLEKAFKSSRTVFIFSLSISSLKRTWFFIRGNLIKCPSYNGTLCQVWMKLVQCLCRRISNRKKIQHTENGSHHRG